MLYNARQTSKSIAFILIATILMSAIFFSSDRARANPMLLQEAEISKLMKSLPDWTSDGKQISRTFKFKNFIEAIDFVNSLVEPAEKAGHHPDIAISYNRVTISLTTHDAGGLTQKDFDLAKIISQLI